MYYRKLFIVVLLLIFFGCSKIFEEKDLYIDRLVYIKADSTLFTGKLNELGDASYYYVEFCDGQPCGEWGERENNKGPFVSKGKYLVSDKVLSDSTRKLISNHIITVNYWQEGGDLSLDPYFLSINILVDDSFFNSDIKNHYDYNEGLALAVMNDTRSLKYGSLKISYVNAIYNCSKVYSKEYKRRG